MSDVIDTEGYRANVGIVLMRGDGSVFLGRRARGGGWQFPQGGMQAGEAPEQALFRELHEEIGLTARDVEVVGATREWLHYRLPARYVRRDQQPLCIGQKQRWFLLRLRDGAANFAFTSTSEPEFDRWRWSPWWEPVREVIFFKRPVYVQMLTELAALAFAQGAPPLPSWWDEATAQRESAGN
ncbi:MAG TPA: RNA pyrophosphohydrolase [Steroidobacteraceae bacterium]|nr:RNA pyrophosphohydrolase [Steroidobacteraceae bacterium]